MIECNPGDTIHPKIEGGPAGQLSALTDGIRLQDAGTVIAALTSAGLTEDPVDDDTSDYTGTLIVPSDVDITATHEVFWEADGEVVGTEEITFIRAEGYRPTVLDVAQHITTRTRNNRGRVIGTFDETTTPSGERVEELLDQFLPEFELDVSETIPADLHTDARTVAALGAAAAVEASYRAEAVDDTNSTYQALRARYERGVTGLQNRIERTGETGGGGNKFASVTLESPYSGSDLDDYRDVLL